MIWTTWESRNNAVFKAKEASITQATDMVKFRVAWWFKHHGVQSKETITAIMLNIKDMCLDSKPTKN